MKTGLPNKFGVTSGEGGVPCSGGRQGDPGRPNKFGVTGVGVSATGSDGRGGGSGQPNKFGVTSGEGGVPRSGGRQGDQGRPNKCGVTLGADPTPNSCGGLGDRGAVAVHYIFPTHNRTPVFEVEEFRALIEKLLLHIAGEKGLEVIALNVLPDHVHVLMLKETRRSDAEVMKLLKGASARYFFQQCPEVKEGLRSQSLWAHGYYGRFVSRGDIPRVVRYIGEQKGDEGTDKRYADGLHVRDSGRFDGGERS